MVNANLGPSSKPGPAPGHPAAAPARPSVPAGPSILKRQLNLFLALLIVIIIGLGLGASTLIQTRVAAMSGNLTAIEDQYANCTQTLDTCHGRLSEKEGKLNTTITDIQLYDALYEEKAAALDQKTSELASTTETLASTEKELDATKNEKKSLQSKLTITENTVASLNSQVAALNTQAESLKKQVQDWKEAYDECNEASG